MGSIEAAYIGLARYIAKHLGELSWFPLWYGGIPYADTYPPLLHMVCGLVVAATGVSPGLAHHFVTATVYALGPVTLFWMAWRLGGNRASALAAGVGYSLISPACLLVKEVRFDAGGLLAGRRLCTLIVYGEGPHLTAHVPASAGHRAAARGVDQTAGVVLRAGCARRSRRCR